MDNVKTIAIYFPQFHAIPENDEWWGKGFTDWNNVRKGYPLYEGHHQPRVPLNNNYYDLSQLDTIRWQVELAKKYGVYGFAIYHYWFDGKQLLETPEKLFLQHPELDIPFCLTWANETWARRWDGNDRQILQLQTHEPTHEKWKEHFDYLRPFFADPRALRIDGRVVFQIYRPHLIDKVDEMIAYWRELAREAGIGELYFMAIKSFDFPDSSILDAFDGVLLFEPHEATNSPQAKGMSYRLENILRHLPESWVERLRAIRTKSRHSYKEYDYQKICDIAAAPHFTYRDKDVFDMAFLEWDNTARYREKATIYKGCTPPIFEKNFRRLVQKAEQKPEGRRFVYINAWNEWAEGTYLEPDEKNGYGYLEAIQRVMRERTQV